MISGSPGIEDINLLSVHRLIRETFSMYILQVGSTQSINQKRIRVTKVTNVTARPLRN